MIIDCHGHYTTAPEQHTLWRGAQVAAFKAGEPFPSYPVISDDEIVDTIEKNQLRLEIICTVAHNPWRPSHE